MLRRRLAGPMPSLQAYVGAELEADALRRDLTAYFARYHVLLCPTVPVPAPPHEAPDCVVEGERLPSRHVARTTAPFNVTGSPALSVPFGLSPEGLPLGVQVVGRHFDEATVLRVGRALETRSDAGRRLPSV